MKLQSPHCAEDAGFCRAEWIQSPAYLFEQGERSMRINAITMTSSVYTALY